MGICHTTSCEGHYFLQTKPRGMNVTRASNFATWQCLKLIICYYWYYCIKNSNLYKVLIGRESGKLVGGFVGWDIVLCLNHIVYVSTMLKNFLHVTLLPHAMLYIYAAYMCLPKGLLSVLEWCIRKVKIQGKGPIIGPIPFICMESVFYFIFFLCLSPCECENERVQTDCVRKKYIGEILCKQH